MRTMENPVHIAAYKGFGIVTTPMAFAEVFTALQQGTVDEAREPSAGDHLSQVRPGAKAPDPDRPCLLATIFLMNKASFDKR